MVLPAKAGSASVTQRVEEGGEIVVVGCPGSWAWSGVRVGGGGEEIICDIIAAKL